MNILKFAFDSYLMTLTSNLQNVKNLISIVRQNIKYKINKILAVGTGLLKIRVTRLSDIAVMVTWVMSKGV